MKHLKFLTAAIVSISLNISAYAQVIITEIMYNPPESGQDFLEYIEIHNRGNSVVDLSGWSFSKGVVFVFPSGTVLQPGAYSVVCEDTAYFRARFPQFFPFEWSNSPVNSALTNSGEPITLVDAFGDLVDSVRYSNTAPWPTGANGQGSSLELCNLDGDNNDAANWQASNTPTGVTSGGLPVFGNPFGPSGCGVPSFPALEIEDVRGVNQNGVSTAINVSCTLEGVVHGMNQSTTGIQFALINQNNVGITVFLGNGNLGYTVNQGDRLRVQGRVNQFNGLTQMAPEQIELLSSGNPTVNLRTVIQPDESTESSLIRINNIRALNPSEWTNMGNFNVRAVSDNHPLDTITIRFDADVDASMVPAPGGLFDVVGLGAQFDNSNPFTEGYQILPQFGSDIITPSRTVQANWSDRITLSPNPASEWIRVQSAMPIDRLVVTDVAGRIMLQTTISFGASHVVLGDMPPGLYIFRFESGASFWATPVVIK
jgi:hypothetical protein